MTTTSLSERLAGIALAMALFFVGLGITVIVIRPALEGGATMKMQKVIEARAWPVATYTSLPGEEKEAFLMRVSPEIEAWTAQNNAETCAFVATDGRGWGLKLITIRSQVDCVFAFGVAPEGMTTTKETFHTHPRMDQGGYVKVNAQSREAMARLGDDVRGKPTWFRIENNNEFSKYDIEAGPGYLITNGQLLYQDGPGKKHLRIVGGISTLVATSN